MSYSFYNINFDENQSKSKKLNWSIAIHGGSQLISNSNSKVLKSKLNKILKGESNHLNNGEKSIDVVTRCISKLENDPCFNAGLGSVIVKNYEHNVQMDACIVDGKTRLSGTVIGVYGVKNPICVARSLLNSREIRVMFGMGAYKYAKQMGCKSVKSNYFLNSPEKYHDCDTVGCVCLDTYGNLSAGSSTGGISKKLIGRVGDVGIVGTGTYAENGVCAVSCSGKGEWFIHKMVAYDIVCKKKYGKRKLLRILNDSEYNRLPGSCIAMDKNGYVVKKDFHPKYKMVWSNLNN